MWWAHLVSCVTCRLALLTGVIEAPFGPVGRYIVGGVTYAGGAGETYVGLNASGHQIWVQRYTGSGVPNHMSTAIDYNMLSLGKTHSGDVFLRKMEFATGNSIWYRTYGGTRAEWAYDITLMDDGTMVLLCETVSFGQGASDVYLINTDYDGIENWHDVYGSVSDEWLTSMVLLPNSVLLGVGLTKSYGHMDGARRMQHCCGCLITHAGFIDRVHHLYLYSRCLSWTLLLQYT
eukprot:m.48542 g.48542  ORF g.48542 m.48542 type:complete len:233 (+) comp15264_c0_seq1:938-1636(+)